MKALDLAIIFGYLIGIVLFGAWFARKQKTTSDYFLGDRSVPWWAVAVSIVATETSTITFISVPGIAFSRGGNFQFLQLVFGYMLGRIVIALLFIPSYFRGELLTVYQLLDRRFGGKIKMLAASLFVVMRNIADGIRLLVDGDRACGGLHFISAGRQRGNDHGRFDNSDWRGDDRLHLFRRDGSGHLGRGRAARNLHRRRDCGGGDSDKLDRRRIDCGTFGRIAIQQVFAIRFFVRPDKDVYVLGRFDRRMFSDDEYARNRSISGPALPLHRSPAACGHGFADQRRNRAGTIHRISCSSACCCLLFIIRTPIQVTRRPAQPRFRLPAAIESFRISSPVILPTGLSGLVVAAIFAAAMSSSLNSIAATSGERSLPAVSTTPAATGIT